MKKDKMGREKAKEIARQGVEVFIKALEDGGIELSDEYKRSCRNDLYRSAMRNIETQYILT